jgi:alpha-L-fucosidase 2
MITITGMFSTLIALGSPSPAQTPSSAHNPVEVGVNWPSFLARHDMRYARLPESWNRGAFLGNGRVGAMLYREKGALLFELGETSITDFQPTKPGATGPSSPMLVRPRLPIGTFALAPKGNILRGTMELSLWNAEVSAEIETSKGKIRLRAYVHASEPLLVIELDLTGGEADLSHAFMPALAVSEVKLFRRFPLTPSDINPAPYQSRDGDNRISVQTRNTGGSHAVGWRQTGVGNKRTIFVSIADGSSVEKTEEAIKSTLHRAAGTSVLVLRKQHQAFWHSYYPQSFLSIPDTRLEGFYFLQMYKLASATRSDAPAIDTLGPWYHHTPWPGIWWNLNIQLSYWPVYTANRLGLGESLLAVIDRNRAALALNSGFTDSAAIGRTSAQDAVSPVTDNDANAHPEHEFGNLMWALHNYWLHYRHAMDDTMLRDRLFPLMKQAVNFYLHVIREDAQGIFHTPKAVSPEYTKPAEDTNYDLSLLRWGLSAVIDADARLKLRDAAIPRYKHVLQHLAAYPRGKNGLDIGQGVPLSESHRHFSHLMMIYPLSMLTPESPPARALIEQSLAHWIGFEGALQGYSFVAASAISSRLGKGDDALSYLNQLISRFVKRNTMYLEAGPVIETPLAAAQAVHEMLLQSHNGVVRVFPALPSTFTDVSFSQLRTEGAFLVSAQRRKGQTHFVTIQSLAGEPLVVSLPFLNPIPVGGDRAYSIEKQSHGTWRIDLKKGETIVVSEQGAPRADIRITPVDANERGRQAFGVRADNPLLPPPSIRKNRSRFIPPAGEPASRKAIPDGVIRDFRMRTEVVGTVYSSNGWEEIAWAHLPNESLPELGVSATPWWNSTDERSRWQSIHSDTDCVDLAAIRRENARNAVAYLSTTIVSPNRQHAVIHLGSSDQSRVEFWGQSGVQTFQSTTIGPLKPGLNSFPVELRAGGNPLLFKIINEQGAWGGCLSIKAADGSTLPGLHVEAN